jgi:Mrp family chromosome partitioning ATPase/capsular polysaccharide biosynthesis protein
MPSNSAAGAVRLSDYLTVVKRQWSVVLACVLVGSGLAVGYLAVAPEEFTARTSILVTQTTQDSGSNAPRAAQINLDTEAQLLRSTDTVTAVADLLDVSSDEMGGLADRMTVTVPPNTEILTISYVGPTAQAARDGAAAFGEAYLDLRRASVEAGLAAEAEALKVRVESVTTQLEEITEAAERLDEGSPERAAVDERIVQLNTQLASLANQQSRLQSTTVTPGRVITEANLPRSPSSPDQLLSLAAGVLLGLLGGLGLAALRDRSDDCIRTEQDLERRTTVPAVAVLTQPVDDRDVVLVTGVENDSRAYGRVRNQVTSSLEGSRRPTVVVTGIRRGCGPVAANVAASLARLGEDVVLLCADAFGRTAEDLLGERPRAGLAEVLNGTATVERAARPLPGLPTLRVLGPGTDAQQADALLQTKSLRRLVDELALSAAYVVIEAPPTALSAAAQTLAPVAEAALLVVDQGVTTAREVADAQAQFGTMRRPVLGAVLATYRTSPESVPAAEGALPDREREARNALLRPEPAGR